MVHFNPTPIYLFHSHTHAHLSLLLFTLQLLSHVPHRDECCQDAAQEQGWEGYTSPPQLPLSKYLHHCIPSPGVVLEQSLKLEQGAQGQKQVEDLVTLTHKVTVAREETLRDGTGEEEGRQKERDDLEGMERQRRFLCPGDSEQAVHYRADVQQVC